MLEAKKIFNKYLVLEGSLPLGDNYTEKDLKKAYRLLAKRYHPDMGEAADEAIFKEVNKANEVLRDYLNKQKNFASSITDSASLELLKNDYIDKMYSYNDGVLNEDTFHIHNRIVDEVQLRAKIIKRRNARKV